MRHHVGCVHNQVQQTSTTGQRENKQGSRVQAESKDGKNTTKLKYTSQQCTNAPRGIRTNNVSRRDGEPRPLAEAGHQTTEQGKKLAPKLRDMGSETSRDT